MKIYGNDEIGELALAFMLVKRVQEAQANTEERETWSWTQLSPIW